MKKLLTPFILVFISLSSLGAKQVDLATAKLAGYNFLRLRTQSAAPADKSDLRLILKSASADEATVYYYVFNTGNGFVIVSGDDCVLPVLGYSNEKEFRPTPMAPNVAKWLESYKAQIRYAIAHNLPATPEITQAWEELKGNLEIQGSSANRSSVDPLVQTKWDQPYPYNELCPGGSVTGCVATAMAQIMKYWNHPATGSGFHSFNHQNYGTLSANFGSTNYQWGNMPNTISSSNNAIATLMYHCGVSVDMGYSPEVSGAWVIENSPTPEANSEYAFKNYFGYDPATMQGIQRNNYSDTQWEGLLKGELDAGRPILYDGFGTGGGHAFVCDGYDDNNFFHYNWGWSGYYDGYFESSALNPGGTGTGGGTGGYNSNQEVIIGIKPKDGGGGGTGGDGFSLNLYDYLYTSANTIYYGESFSVSTNIRNNGAGNFSGDYCAAVFDANLNFVDFIEIKTGWSLGAGNVYTDGITFSTNGLYSMLPGQYYAAVFYREADGDWSIVGNGEYVNIAEISVIHYNDIELYSDMVVSPGTTLTQGQPASVHLNILNDGTFTFYGTYSVDIYDLYGNWVENIAEINEPTGLPPGYLYLEPYLTFYSTSIDAPPGTYLLALTHLRDGGDWELSGSYYFQNPIYITVKAPAIQADSYENNDDAAHAYALSLNFSGNAATKNTIGSNCHHGTDYDFYKLNLPQGYNYTITARLHDAFNSGNGNTYTLDGQFSVSGDGVNWSEPFDDVMPGDILVNGGGTLYFVATPYFPGQTGSYLLDMQITRTPVTASHVIDEADAVHVFPNPASDIIHIDLRDTEQSFEYLTLVNAEGQLLLQEEVRGTENLALPVSEFAPGMHFILLQTQEGVLTKKVMIAR